MEQAERTIPKLWRDALARGTEAPAYLAERDGTWEPISWEEAGRRVDDLANGLLALGVRKGDAFGILATTTPEWALFDMALALVGAVTAPVYMSSSQADIEHVLTHSDAIGVLVEEDEQRQKLATVPLQHVLAFADLPNLEERGREFAGEHPDALAAATAAVHEDDLYTFIYTSGTTGPPKACMIRHRNYYEMAAYLDRLDDFVVEADTMLLYLPLAHNFGRLMVLAGAYAGYTVAFLPDPLRAAEALVKVRPTVFPSVPRVYEKVHANIVTGFDALTGPKRALADWAMRVGRRVSKLRQEQKPLPPLLAAQHRLADKLVYSKVKARLGGRLRIGISGAAPLAPEILEFFHALDVLILEGWGLTECTTAATVNRPSKYRFGTVGPALPGVEVRVEEDGELLVRSETIFAGYYKDEEATREVLAPEGWLRTGDVGEIDADGFVKITDRKKDILVTAGGKNVAPQNLENELKTSKYVSQALVLGDKRPYVAALITLDEPEIEAWQRNGGGNVEALVQEIVDGVNAKHSRYEQIKRFAILPRDFSLADGELTPTLKVKRRVAQQNFAGEIEKLYS